MGSGPPASRIRSSGARPAGLAHGGEAGRRRVAVQRQPDRARAPVTLGSRRATASGPTRFELRRRLSGSADTSPARAVFTVGVPREFTITTRGFPISLIRVDAGNLPDGLTFADNHGRLLADQQRGDPPSHAETYPGRCRRRRSDRRPPSSRPTMSRAETTSRSPHPRFVTARCTALIVDSGQDVLDGLDRERRTSATKEVACGSC